MEKLYLGKEDKVEVLDVERKEEQERVVICSRKYPELLNCEVNQAIKVNMSRVELLKRMKRFPKH